MKDPNIILKKALDNEEPVFVLRAKDALSLCAISAYLHSAAIVIQDEEQFEELEIIYKEFRLWKSENQDKVKLPD